MPLPIRLLLHTILNILLAWALSSWLSDYFFLSGGWTALLITGCLLTLLNMLVRPLLDIVLLPLKLLATLMAFIIANGVFLWITVSIASLMDGDLITLTIDGGIGGWIVVSIALGLGNWVIRHAVHARRTKVVVREVRNEKK